MSTYAQNQNGQVKNTNRWSTKQLVTMALMCAIAILLSFLEFPIFPAASFLKLDISFVPSAVMGFAYGTGPGILVGVACALLAWFFEIWVDNNFARVKWQLMLKSAWIVALVCGGVNVVFLAML